MKIRKIDQSVYMGKSFFPEGKCFGFLGQIFTPVLAHLEINTEPRVLCNSRYGNGAFAPFANGNLLNSDSNKIPFAKLS